MTTTATEHTLGLAEAAQLVPGSRGAPKAATQTLMRWATKGARARDGRRVYLAATKVGGCWYTSAVAMRHFLDSLNRTPDVIPPRTPARTRRDSEAAGKKLAKLGL